jgi:hypothetical protein
MKSGRVGEDTQVREGAIECRCKSSWLHRELMISNSLYVQLMHTNDIKLLNY